MTVRDLLNLVQYLHILHVTLGTYQLMFGEMPVYYIDTHAATLTREYNTQISPEVLVIAHKMLEPYTAMHFKYV